MQTVSGAFDTMAWGDIRYPIQRLFISWLNDYNPSVAFFTIGTSLIGGTDIIKGTGSSVAESDKFSYTEESDNVMLLEYDREFVEPVSSVAKALADIQLDNNNDRFTPGVDPTIGTHILPRRPVRFHLGFNTTPLPELVQVFVGEIAEFPNIDRINNIVTIHCQDFFDTIWNTPLQNSVSYQNERSDQVLDSILQIAGLTSGQYVLDAGVNVIGFAYFDPGTLLGEIIQKICEAELGRFYLDETGVYHFENRQHWLNNTTPVITLTNAMVVQETLLPIDKIVNVVEVTAHQRNVVANQLIWQTSSPKPIEPGQTIEFFTSYSDPVAVVTSPTVAGSTSSFYANTAADGSGVDLSTSVTKTLWTDFSQSSKAQFTNTAAQTVFLTVVVWGTPAIITNEIFIRYQDDSSVATYGEHVITIENDFIQNQDFAKSLAQILVTDRKNPGDYRDLIVLGYPPLQLGDLVSWQGNNYNIIRIKGRLSAADGLIQTITLVKRTIQAYFTIGVSTIGSATDQIAP